MFGTYRTLLSFAVVASHLATIPYLGQFAVHGFFVLSGFLMTHVMHRTYGYTLRGRLTFAASRALRLYPMYGAVLILTALTIVVLGADRVAAFKDTIQLPRDVVDLLQNLTMVYARWMPMTEPVRLVPPTWALTIEILFYALICAGLSRTRLLTGLWLAGSIAAVLLTLAYKGDDFASRYSTLLSGSLPFAVGASVYHWREPLERGLVGRAPLRFAAVAFCVFPVLAIGSWLLRKAGLEPLSIAFFYLNTPLHGLIVIVLLNAEADRSWKKRDSRIGDYSYPVYLLHYLAGLWVATLMVEPLGLGRYGEALLTFAIALPLSLAVSFALLRWIDAPVERWRRQIKSGSSAKTAEDDREAGLVLGERSSRGPRPMSAGLMAPRPSIPRQHPTNSARRGSPEPSLRQWRR